MTCGKKLVYSTRWNTLQGFSQNELAEAIREGGSEKSTQTVNPDRIWDTDRRDRHSRGAAACLEQLNSLV